MSLSSIAGLTKYCAAVSRSSTVSLSFLLSSKRFSKGVTFNKLFVLFSAQKRAAVQQTINFLTRACRMQAVRFTSPEKLEAYNSPAMPFALTSMKPTPWLVANVFIDMRSQQRHSGSDLLDRRRCKRLLHDRSCSETFCADIGALLCSSSRTVDRLLFASPCLSPNVFSTFNTAKRWHLSTKATLTSSVGLFVPKADDCAMKAFTLRSAVLYLSREQRLTDPCCNYTHDQKSNLQAYSHGNLWLGEVYAR